MELLRKGRGEAGSLAAALWQCTALTHLDLSQSLIGAEGAGLLLVTVVLGAQGVQCTGAAQLKLQHTGCTGSGAARQGAGEVHGTDFASVQPQQDRELGRGESGESSGGVPGTG
eukprot:3681920-Rhodomonas_salina.2